ncbi:MAG: PilZ domain-containing protein [Candidatus Omnitrophota bacterium]
MSESIAQDSAMEDRRIFERRNFNSLLKFRNTANNRNGDGFIRNISAGGVAFSSNDKLKRSDALELWINVPDNRGSISKTARVVWVKENLLNRYEAGVKFDSVGLMELSGIFRSLAR